MKIVEKAQRGRLKRRSLRRLGGKASKRRDDRGHFGPQPGLQAACLASVCLTLRLLGERDGDMAQTVGLSTLRKEALEIPRMGGGFEEQARLSGWSCGHARLDRRF